MRMNPRESIEMISDDITGNLCSPNCMYKKMDSQQWQFYILKLYLCVKFH